MADAPLDRPAVVELLADATQRLTRTVDGLPQEAWSGPSLLPGWSRAHVAAHLTLNAEALAGVLKGLVAGEPTSMYASQQARDHDIEELSTASDPELRDRFLGSSTELADAVAALPEDGWDGTFLRTPEADRVFPVSDIVWMRWSEVEIHHADLASTYTRADWPPAFAAHLVDRRLRRQPEELRLVARASDSDQVWGVPGPGLTVTGSTCDLAWWLTGRGRGEGLEVEGGELPPIGAM